MNGEFDLDFHCMMMEVVLANLTPIQYLRIQKNKYFHDISNYALSIDVARKLDKPESYNTLAIVAAITGNHYLILSNMQGKMPDKEGNILLEELINSMDTVRGFISKPTKEILPAIDEMYLKWAQLELYSENQSIENK
jgi:hypothetical protein